MCEDSHVETVVETISHTRKLRTFELNRTNYYLNYHRFQKLANPKAGREA
jgi:hypothetical protein